MSPYNPVHLHITLFGAEARHHVGRDLSWGGALAGPTRGGFLWGVDNLMQATLEWEREIVGPFKGVIGVTRDRQENGT